MKPIRLETTSADGTKINLEALYQIAPSCFTEAKDEETGEIKRVVNFETLRQLLGGDVLSFLEGASGDLFSKEIKGLDDFELICFFVVR